MADQPNPFETPRGGGNGNRPQGTLPERTEEVAERARAAAIERVEQARDRTREEIDQGRQQLAERIRHLGSALRSASERLRDEDRAVAHYADLAGERVDRVASYVSSADLRSTVRDVERFAKRQPAVFFGGAFLLGLAAGRFLRSSQRDRNGGEESWPRQAESRTASDWPSPPRPRSTRGPETEPAGLFDPGPAGSPPGVTGSSGQGRGST